MSALWLVRRLQNAHATIGELYLGRTKIAVTLEDGTASERGPIPPGVYQMALTYSGRFQQLLPEVLGVPERTGIRLHAGNTERDTTGCILLGRHQVSDHEIGQSRLAMGDLLTRWPDWADEVITIEEAFS